MSRIYLASSWRNPYQPAFVLALRQAGHRVYDFRNPPNNSGFGWEQVCLEPKPTVAKYLEALKHPIAQAGFTADFDAMKWADTCVLLLPCGRSAHLEAGWCIGTGRRTIIVTRDGEEPELMALMASRIVGSLEELLAELGPA